MSDQMIQIPRDELETIMKEAAKEGAKAALAEVGLNDEDAGKDIKELRNLIDSWRSSKKSSAAQSLKWPQQAYLSSLRLP